MQRTMNLALEREPKANTFSFTRLRNFTLSVLFYWTKGQKYETSHLDVGQFKVSNSQVLIWTQHRANVCFPRGLDR